MMKPKKPEKGSPGLLRQQASRPSTKRVLIKYEVVSTSQDHVSPYPGNTVLQRAILRQQSRVEYAENCGALFMPLSRGGYSETPYCPACFRPMWCFHEAFPYECTNRRRPSHRRSGRRE